MPLEGNGLHSYYPCLWPSEDFIEFLQLVLIHLDPIAAQDTGDYFHFLTSFSPIFWFSHQFVITLVFIFQFLVFVIFHLLLSTFKQVFTPAGDGPVLHSDVSFFLRFPKIDASEPAIPSTVFSPALILTTQDVVSRLILQPLLPSSWSSSTLLLAFVQLSISQVPLAKIKSFLFLRPPTAFSASIFRVLTPLFL